jgi:predicted outer membrane repeat protein
MARRVRGLTRVLLVTLLMASSLHFAPPALATTHTVCPSGCDFTTIAAALQAASDGDAISVEAGTYAGGFTVEKNVDLRGAGRDKTTIQGTSEASVIRVGTRANVAIEGVTITGGGGSRTRANDLGGGGILNEGGLTLSDSVVRANIVANGEGGGIYSHASKTLKILNSDIEGNRATDGGGVYVRNGDVVLEDTTVASNRSTRNGGGINHQGGETLRLERSTVSGNRADMFGGGIASSSEVVLIDSQVVENRAVNVGGIAGGRERLKIVDSTIRGNFSAGSGGGIRVGAGGVELAGSVVEQNRSTGANGAGIFANSLSGDVSLKNTTLSGNVAAQDGGGILNEKSEIVLDNSKVIDNQAGRNGGGIYSRTATKGIIKLRNGSAVTGNQPDQCYPAGLRC